MHWDRMTECNKGFFNTELHRKDKLFGSVMLYFEGKTPLIKLLNQDYILSSV